MYVYGWGCKESIILYHSHVPLECCPQSTLSSELMCVSSIICTLANTIPTPNLFCKGSSVILSICCCLSYHCWLFHHRLLSDWLTDWLNVCLNIQWLCVFHTALLAAASLSSSLSNHNSKFFLISPLSECRCRGTLFLVICYYKYQESLVSICLYKLSFYFFFAKVSVSSSCLVSWSVYELISFYYSYKGH
jgi:hypothetical protein